MFMDLFLGLPFRK